MFEQNNVGIRLVNPIEDFLKTITCESAANGAVLELAQLIAKSIGKTELCECFLNIINDFLVCYQQAMNPMAGRTAPARPPAATASLRLTTRRRRQRDRRMSITATVPLDLRAGR